VVSGYRDSALPALTESYQLFGCVSWEEGKREGAEVIEGARQETGR
jgi:hypothetical protein